MNPVAQLHHNLTNHAPASPEIVARFEGIRADARSLGETILEYAPESRERSLAITHLEQTVMWAVAGIARNQDAEPGGLA